MRFEDNFDAVLFDMDGTLLDSMSYWRRFNLEYPARHGLTLSKEMRAKLPSIRNAEAVAYIIEEFHLDKTVEELLDENRAAMQGYYQREIQPKPHALEYLDHLRKIGKRMCVATATPLWLSRPALEKHGIAQRMEFVLSAKDEGLDKGKPEFYRLVADRLHLPCARCALFDDSLFAMRGAKEAGLWVMAMEEKMQGDSREEIESVADLYVRDFGELCV